MSITKILIPTSTNESTIHTGNQYPKNNAITSVKHGMPGKSGAASDGITFGIARQYYFQYLKPSSEKHLEELYKKKANESNQNTRQFKTSNSSIKTSTFDVGKPIPQTSSDLYLQRKRLIAIGHGSTNKKGEQLSFNGADKNIPSQALNRVKAGGSIATKYGVIGSSQPSIFARRSKR